MYGGARFFFAVIVWGELRLRDIPAEQEWVPQRITYWDEAYLDSISVLGSKRKKIRTAQEFDEAIIATPEGIQPLWIDENLLSYVKRRWNDQLGRSPP